MLRVKDLFVEKDEKRILNGVNLEVSEGVNVILGPNGSGKTTLLRTIMGDPRYKVINGRIEFLGKDITDLPPNERYKLGISLMVQNPPKLPIKFRELLSILKKEGVEIECPKIKDLLDRNLFDGFSGGEKKRAEFLLSIVGRPKLLMLDEPDSGVDVDSIRILGRMIEEISSNTTVLLVTHTGMITREIGKVSKVFIMKDGKILKEGGEELLRLVLERGFNWM